MGGLGVKVLSRGVFDFGSSSGLGDRDGVRTLYRFFLL
jgi:hypothetical protein